MPSGGELLAREQRWAKPVAIAALLAVAIFLVSGFIGAGTNGEGDAELLRSVHEHSSNVTLVGVMETIAFALLALPLVYLFKAVQGRAAGVRGAMLGLVILAPLCLAIATGFGAVTKHDAASRFVAGDARSTLSKKEAREECSSELKEKGAKSLGEKFDPQQGETALAACQSREIEDDEASNALSEASTASIATFFGFAGGLSLIIGLFYTSLWAMRTGILSRFWAALGMALGVTVLLGIILFLLIWFAYLGLLIAAWIPKGRPPAWAAGEAIPWPTPGEKAAADLVGEDEPDELPSADPEADPDDPASEKKGN
jgi:hypothetical protein